MTSVGLIHIRCICEAELLYLGNTPDGTLPTGYVDRCLSQLRPGRYGVFSSADGEVGECPHCGIQVELPDPRLIDWLPFADPATVSTIINILQSEEVRD